MSVEDTRTGDLAKQTSIFPHSNNAVKLNIPRDPLEFSACPVHFRVWGPPSEAEASAHTKVQRAFWHVTNGPQKPRPWFPGTRLSIKPSHSHFVRIQVSLLESHRTTEQQEMMPGLCSDGQITNQKTATHKHLQHRTPATARNPWAWQEFQERHWHQEHWVPSRQLSNKRQESPGSSAHVGMSHREKLLFS